MNNLSSPKETNRRTSAIIIRFRDKWILPIVNGKFSFATTQCIPGESYTDAAGRTVINLTGANEFSLTDVCELNGNDLSIPDTEKGFLFVADIFDNECSAKQYSLEEILKSLPDTFRRYFTMAANAT